MHRHSFGWFFVVGGKVSLLVGLAARLRLLKEN